MDKLVEKEIGQQVEEADNLDKMPNQQRPFEF
jgi:hypothetical protein